ncbi:MAG: excinuclease ABC subunit UvrA [Burkholderiaceae bacterium]
MTDAVDGAGPVQAGTNDDAGPHLAHALRAGAIRVRGARQNNLKNLSLDIPTGELVVVTGVSGSGKSSLVFDTVYAEGQRRYVETFSAYARQFLDRMDKPQVDRIEGVPPAIAIDQTNPVRTSRSTVGTMTELNDHLKLLFARLAHLQCRGCGEPVGRDDPASVCDRVQALAHEAGDPRLAICFPVPVPANFSLDEVQGHLKAQGYDRVLGTRQNRDGSTVVDVIQDRLRAGRAGAQRLAEAIDTAMARGHGRVSVHPLNQPEGEDSPLDADGQAAMPPAWRFSRDLHCARCDIAYDDPLPSLFSFNSPIGACETCRGFGRVIGVDLGLVIPDESLSLREGAVKPWQSKSFLECQRDLTRCGKAAGIALDTPWQELPESERRWVIDGEPGFSGKWQTQWYGIDRFFKWLESKAYKMHIRVLLSRYRAYRPCPTCDGARLKPDALLWRAGDREAAGAAGIESGENGLSIHQMMLLPIRRLARFFETLRAEQAGTTQAEREALEMLLTEIRARLGFLREVGLDYLTLDRQSRTLSGGEVQRINLTTALGTSLVNTLFVLDEPSIGLHPRDMTRIIRVMTRLRDAGNSLLVVEHDPLVMLAADRIIDIGPGPGEHGGHIVFEGPARAMHGAQTLTADYLSGRRRIDAGRRQAVKPGTPRLLLEGVRANNLKGIDLSLPLGRLVCVTGVSGSGKSTLIQDVLLPALLKKRGKPTESPGEHDRLLGDDWLDDVAFVDQSPIGKTARSNPASYVGAFDIVRQRFAAPPASRERGFTAGTFSFNAGNGRCPTCRGNGFEHVEMQFLSDVYLRCPDCDGSRYRPETLEVRLAPAVGACRADGRLHEPLSIAGVLELTVAEALAFFGEDRELRARLRPLSDVGLDYLRLGQPVPTLSGGEAQRLKLAGFLAEAGDQAARRVKRARCGTLFMFDEPTTGLHFDDVSRLLGALRRLVDAGHSLVVIEHNLDVIGAADWVIDLGPEGGEDGGRIVATGTPQALCEHPDSHTGRALAGHLQAGNLFDHDEYSVPMRVEEAQADPYSHAMRERARHAITVHHARENNLQGIDVEIPRNALSVITGVSGSGKSTLAFDVVFGEGQRRYLESLNAYARQFVQPASRPDVDGVYGIPPTVSIEQRTSRGGRKSTVATLTEIYHFLRLLYVKLGTQYCPDCQVPIEPQDFERIVARIGREYRGRHIGLLAPLIVSRKGLYTDLAKWARGHGHSHLRVDGEFLPTQGWPRLDRYVEHNIELPIADLIVEPANEPRLREALSSALEHGKGVVMLATGLEALRAAIDTGDLRGSTAPLQTILFSTQRACPSCGTSFPELDPRLFSFNSRLGWCRHCLGTGVKLPATPKAPNGRHGDEDTTTEAIGMIAERLADQIDDQSDPQAPAGAGPAACEPCGGHRLNPTALAVRLRGRSIAEVTADAIDDCAGWVTGLTLDDRERAIGRDSLQEIVHRLGFLSEVGLGYLSLDRAAPTLSGGEAQRIRLAGQLGSNLQGVCYVLDEPSIGLHPRDNRMLLDTLLALRDKGNTLIVVEHDEETMREADHLIDIGPRAGREGGRVVATGDVAALSAQPASITGHYLANPLPHPLDPARVCEPPSQWLTLEGIERHNLRDVDVRIPLGRLTVITGVSGSGKSTLAREILLPNVRRQVLAKRRRGPVALDGLRRLQGWQSIGRVMEVDQTPIGKTPRSCPATYIGFWDAIRRLFADSAEARLRGYSTGRFSFNTAGGRCPACEGQGQQTIEMSFLPDVKVHCDVCGGRRFNRDTLEIEVRGRSIGDVLRMSVDEALVWFENHESIRRPLTLLADVGLGYLTLGQPSPTLSGGEAQRIKLVAELARLRNIEQADRRRGQVLSEPALYVLDEPTVGLHMADVEKLIRVLHRLVDAGNTVVVVEHDIDIWAEADWLIDLGPGGGAAGGKIVATGAPAEIIGARTATGIALDAFLARQAGAARVCA